MLIWIRSQVCCISSSSISSSGDGIVPIPTYIKTKDLWRRVSEKFTLQCGIPQWANMTVNSKINSNNWDWLRGRGVFLLKLWPIQNTMTTVIWKLPALFTNKATSRPIHAARILCWMVDGSLFEKSNTTINVSAASTVFYRRILFFPDDQKLNNYNNQGQDIIFTNFISSRINVVNSNTVKIFVVVQPWFHLHNVSIFPQFEIPK